MIDSFYFTDVTLVIIINTKTSALTFENVKFRNVFIHQRNNMQQ